MDNEIARLFAQVDFGQLLYVIFMTSMLSYLIFKVISLWREHRKSIRDYSRIMSGLSRSIDPMALSRRDYHEMMARHAMYRQIEKPPNNYKLLNEQESYMKGKVLSIWKDKEENE